MAIKLIGILLPVLALRNATMTQTGTKDIDWDVTIGREFDYTITVETAIPCERLLVRVYVPDMLECVSHKAAKGMVTVLVKDADALADMAELGKVATLRFKTVKAGTGKLRMSAEYRVGRAYIDKAARIEIDVVSVNSVTVTK